MILFLTARRMKSRLSLYKVRLNNRINISSLHEEVARKARKICNKNKLHNRLKNSNAIGTFRKGFEQSDALFKLSNLHQELTIENLKSTPQINRNKSIKTGRFNKMTISHQYPVSIDNRGNKLGLGSDMNFVSIQSSQKTFIQPKINEP